MSYEGFIGRKAAHAQRAGFDAVVDNPTLFAFQRDVVVWALAIGRAAVFADTGLGKTAMQLEWAHQVVRHTGGRVLVLAPLAVGAQTVREAAKFGIPDVAVCRSQDDVRAGICVTNYERLHLFDPDDFAGVVLDESSILKAYTGATKQRLQEAFANTPYRLACTATPAPNDHLELGNHAEFLGVMTSHKMIARWFISDQGQAGSYRLKGHAVRPYWDWVTSWARCIGKPSDMGPYSDDGYTLPPLNEHRHSVAVDQTVDAGDMLFRLPEMSATSIHREKRRTSEDRADHVAALVRAEPTEPWVIWVETNYDADAILERLPEAVDVRGSMDADEKAARLLAFSDNGGIMLTKAGIAGMGLNWQHCARVAFTGLSFSYEQYYQAIRRCWRFGQARAVEVHVVMANTEAVTWSVLDRKADAHDAMKAHMFAASRRAVGRQVSSDPYHPTKSAPVPAWLQESP